jgi:hypothetical protein
MMLGTVSRSGRLARGGRELMKRIMGGRRGRPVPQAMSAEAHQRRATG